MTSRARKRAGGFWRRLQTAARLLVKGSGGDVITSTHDLMKVLERRNITASGVAVNERNAMGVPSVFACVRIIAQALAMCPLAVYRIERRDEGQLASFPLYDHPVTRRLAVVPNRYDMTPFTLVQLVVAHVLLRGNAYLFMRRANGELVEIIPLHPDRMQIEDVHEHGPDGELEVIYKYNWLHGSQQWFRSSEILHLRGLTTNGLLGLSVLDVAREAIGLSLQQEKFAAKLFSQGANPSGMLKHPQKLSAEIVERLRQQLNDLYAGADNAHKTVILEEGMDWTKMTFTAEEAQFLDSRKFQRSEIAAFFGVPPHMLGDVDKSTSWGSGIEQQAIGFVVNTLEPWATAIAQQMRLQMLSPGEVYTHDIRFDLEKLIVGDLASRASAYKTMIEAGIMNPNEARGKLGMNPRRDDWGDDYVYPGQTIDARMRQVYEIAAGAVGPTQATSPHRLPAPETGMEKR